MSADTTVVIAAYRFPGDSELAYTAAVVGAAENLADPEEALRVARHIFLDPSRNREWFRGKGGFSRAKQFANLIAQEERENGILEYEGRPMIEIGTDRVYILSRKGKRTGQECKPSGVQSGTRFKDRTNRRDGRTGTWIDDHDPAYDRAMRDYTHRGPHDTRHLPDRTQE